MPSVQKVLYGSHIAETCPAAGVRGVLCTSASGGFFFRVYAQDHSFTDYELRHDDLEVTIADDAFASFYRIEDEYILDHSPSVLGLIAADADSENTDQGAPTMDVIAEPPVNME